MAWVWDIQVDTRQRLLHCGQARYPCAIGISGAIAQADKREGDGRTPLGRFALRSVLYRADRLDLPTSLSAQLQLPVRPLARDDGWCDQPGHPAYNRPVHHPLAASAEKLWREDGRYDIIVTLGHNDDPVIDGLGSAIFWHCAAPDPDGRSAHGLLPTAGCVALLRDDLLACLTACAPGAALEIR